MIDFAINILYDKRVFNYTDVDWLQKHSFLGTLKNFAKVTGKHRKTETKTIFSEVATRGVLEKKMILKISGLQLY